MIKTTAPFSFLTSAEIDMKLLAAHLVYPMPETKTCRLVDKRVTFLLQRIVKQWFVEQLKGINGGFYFDTSKSELPLQKIIISIEGDGLFHGCGFGLKKCDENNPCPLHENYAPIRNAIESLVTNESIQSLASKNTDGSKVFLNRIGV